MVISGLVLDTKCIEQQYIKQKRITVKRIRCMNNGTRIWWQILTTDNEYYQRWSCEMNNTDECLILTEPDDELDIQYVVNGVRDEVHYTIEPFERNVILNANLIFE